jgi:hypothetical protein
MLVARLYLGFDAYGDKLIDKALFQLLTHNLPAMLGKTGSKPNRKTKVQSTSFPTTPQELLLPFKFIHSFYFTTPARHTALKHA